jgi:polyhydroxyalkanoate synthesis regulator phasin
MRDAWRAYLELALGLSEASRKKAEKAVKNVVGKGYGKSQATATQLHARAEELIATSKANREALAKLVRYEVDRALGAVGLATSEEVSELTERVRRLERQQEGTTAAAAEPAGAAAATAAKQAAAAKATPRMPVAKKTVAKKTVAKKTVAKQPAAKRTVPKKTPPPSAGTVGA